MILPKDCFNNKIQIDGFKKLIYDNKLKNNLFGLKQLEYSLNILEKEYQESDCKKNEDINECLSIDNEINILTNQIALLTKKVLIDQREKPYLDIKINELNNLKTKSISLNCVSAIEKQRQQVVSSVISKYSEIDKTRIEEETKKEVKIRTIFAGVIIVVALGMIIKFSKNDK